MDKIPGRTSRLRPRSGGGGVPALSKIADLAQIRPLALLMAAALLSSCSTIQTLEGRAAFSVGAVPLVFASVNPQDDTVNKEWETYKASMKLTKTTHKEYLGFVASASETRCADFLTGLVVANTGTHTGLDMLTTVFSALGTAFTPLATVHAMAAGATISSGWRANIDADVYAKQAVQDMVHAIQTTYYVKIGDYVDKLATTDENTLIVPAELTKIQTIHAECTLASAQGAVQAALATEAKTPAAASDTATLTITVSPGTAQVKDEIDLTLQSPNLKNIPKMPLVIAVATHDRAGDIANKIANKINGLNLPDVSAAAATGKPGNPRETIATVGLTSLSSDKVTWSVLPPPHSGASGVTVDLKPAASQPRGQTPTGQPAAAPPAKR